MVSTLCTAGRVVSLGVQPGYFSRIFIDEAGCGTEPEMLIPLALLTSKGTATSTSNDTKGASLVLAGDPKQLGPILRSPVSLKYGLNLSMLERLMTNPEFKVYQKGRENISSKI